MDSSKGVEKLFCHRIDLIFFLLWSGRKGSTMALFALWFLQRFYKGSLTVYDVLVYVPCLSN